MITKTDNMLRRLESLLPDHSGSASETRFEQLNSSISRVSAQTEHKVDILSGKIDERLARHSSILTEVKDDNKETRRAVWGVGITAILAILGLFVAIWIGGISQEANLIAIFQAGLGTRQFGPTSSVTTPPPTSEMPAQPVRK